MSRRRIRGVDAWVGALLLAAAGCSSRTPTDAGGLFASDGAQGGSEAGDGRDPTNTGSAGGMTDGGGADDAPLLDVGAADSSTGASAEGGGGDGCRKVDVIIAVDNSSSMQEEIAVLEGPVFDSFPQQLLAVGPGLEDFHLAVMDACNAPPHYHDAGETGACNFSTGTNFMRSDSGQIADEYRCAIDFQPSDCEEDEQPVNTAGDAVSAPAVDGANGGFLRDDAVLFVVAITDEDESPVPAQTVQQLADKIIAAKGSINDVVFLGIGADPQGGEFNCQGPYGLAWRAQDLRQISQIFVDAGRGVFWDLCQGDLETAFAEALEVVDFACDDFDPEG